MIRTSSRRTATKIHSLLQDNGYMLESTIHNLFGDRFHYKSHRGSFELIYVNPLKPLKGSRDLYLRDNIDDNVLAAPTLLRYLGFLDMPTDSVLSAVNDVDEYLGNIKDNLRYHIKKILLMFPGQYESPEQFKELAASVADKMVKIAKPRGYYVQALHLLNESGILKGPSDVPEALEVLDEKNSDYKIYTNNSEGFFDIWLGTAVRARSVENVEDLRKLNVKQMVRML